MCKCEWLFILKFVREKLRFLKKITIDFEPGLVSAANTINLKIFGCYFHYLQNLHLKTQEFLTTTILVSICETIPFCKKYIRDMFIGKLKKIVNNKKIYDKNKMFDDNKMIKYLENIISSKSINKFNYKMKDTHDFFKLTNNCCERFFRYLKREAMPDKYTFEESISTRVYLDKVNFFETGKKSKLEEKYNRANSLIYDLVDRYIEKANKGHKFLICKKKPKKDKNFDKSKKINILKLKNYDFIEAESQSNSGSEFSNGFTDEKTTRSLNYLKKIRDDDKNHSEKYKNNTFNYIEKGLKSNLEMIIKVENQGKEIKSLKYELGEIKKTLKKLKKE